MIANVVAEKRAQSSLDDSLDVFPCHGVGGMCGMVFTAVFATQGGLITGDSALFMKHLGALVMVALFTGVGSLAIFKVIDMIVPLRVSEEDEQLGLDMSQHGESVEEGMLEDLGYPEGGATNGGYAYAHSQEPTPPQMM